MLIYMGIETKTVEKKLNSKEKGDISVRYYSSLGSTNKKAKELGEENLVVIAGEQTEGKGRGDSGWKSEAGGGIYLSYNLDPGIEASILPRASYAVSLALAEVLRDFGCENPEIKWPNDLLARGAKIAGILIESSVEKGVVKIITIGIGINTAYKKEQLEEIEGKYPATSLFVETETQPEEETLIVETIGRINGVLPLIREDSEFRKLVESWWDYSVFKPGTRIGYQKDGNYKGGEVMGITREGTLSVNRRDGRDFLTAAHTDIKEIEDAFDG